MSLSLSSLLNPSPEADSALSPGAQQQPQAPPDSNNPPGQQKQVGASPLASSASQEQSQSQWYSEQDRAHRSVSHEQRPGSSGFGEAYHLPPPNSATGRKMSSPTLEQYRVASRSPEQRRASLLSPVSSDMTLPPLQGRFPMDQSNMGHQSSSAQEETPDLGTPRETQSHAAGTAIADKHLHSSHLDSGVAPLPRSSHPTLNTHIPPPAPEDVASSPAYIKQENVPTPQTSSPPDSRRLSLAQDNFEPHVQRQVAHLKTENSIRYSSPLRESSVPMPSTEVTTSDNAVAKKRPAPSKTKKGMAVTTKKTAPAKKRKLERPARSATPSSLTSKSSALKTVNGKATPLNSSPARSTRSPSADGDEEPYEDDDAEEGDSEGDGDVYCLCRKPDTGTFMIGCDGTCDDWFHGKCVNIEERDKNLIDKYICPNCAEAGIGRTSWKRMCRRSGCRQAARVGKSKTGKKGSKYCSEECGLMHFQVMLARTRGREDIGKHRSSRRQWGATEPRPQAENDDLGARGGVLAAGEIKSLIDYSSTADDFKRLGDGVLSPPATPNGKTTAGAAKKKDESLNDSERQAIERITHEKDIARRKHQLLKDRMKFVTMAKQAAARVATERELKPKDFCGYDSRIQWTQEQFRLWQDSTTGQHALASEHLTTAKPETADAMDLDQQPAAIAAAEQDDDDYEICDRKKCARHLDWAKLAIDDVRFEMGDNSDHMRALDREEHDVRERAALRAKRMEAGGWGVEGNVEIHIDAGPAKLAVLKEERGKEEKADMDGGQDPEIRVVDGDTVMAD